MRARSLLPIALLAFSLHAIACATSGPYVWYDELPPSGGHARDVVIQSGDVVNVRVFNQEALSTKERVRTDGKISMTVIGEITARGKRPAQLASEIQDRLKSVIVAPSVVVAMEQTGEMKVAVVGEVRNGGIFQMEPGSSVLHALAAAGGLNDFADTDRIFVVRKTLPQRVRFRYADLKRAEAKSLQFLLENSDVIVVE